MFANRPPKVGSARRVLTLATAAALHGGVLVLVLVLGRPAVKAVAQVIPIKWVRPAGGDHHDTMRGNGGAEKTHARTKVATAKALTKKDLTQPQVIPSATPEPVATATEIADAAAATATPNDGTNGATKDGLPGFGDGCPTCDGTDPNGKGPGDDPNLPGGRGPVDPHAIGVTPIAMFQPQPAYPSIARASGLAGEVVVEIVVGTDGRVMSARVVRSQPPFDQSALSTVRTWRYVPLLVRGQPAAWRGEVTIRFQLR